MINQIEPWIDNEELEQLKRVIDSTFVTEAELTKEFEEMTKKMTGSEYAIAMTNGTVATFCALKALNIGDGDEVIVPNMTFIASANAVIMAGAIPVLCDVYENTFCINVEEAELLISEKTKAIMPVHLYGQSADMLKIMSLSEKYNIKVIEDAAQGVGVKFLDKHVGTFGDVGILSYYGNKTITTGEGGMILTNDEKIAEKCYRLKNHGRINKGIFIHDEIGYNFSFTEMQAALGIAQMKKLSQVISKKEKINNLYINELKDISDLKPIFIDSRTSAVYWFTSFLCKNLDDFSNFLFKNKIQTRRFFLPLHLQPCYQKSKIKIRMNTKYPISKRIFNMGISLPSSYSLQQKQQIKIIKIIKDYYSA